MSLHEPWLAAQHTHLHYNVCGLPVLVHHALLVHGYEALAQPLQQAQRHEGEDLLLLRLRQLEELWRVW